MDNQVIMDNYRVRRLFVRAARLESTVGYMVAPKHLSSRSLGRVGVVLYWVPGHGGDVWAVQHDNEDIGVYCYTELELVGELTHINPQGERT